MSAKGFELPDIQTSLPGPASKAMSQRLGVAEAPGINTLYRGEPALVWQAAQGCNVWDADGNRFLDLTSGFGVASIGHRHPLIVEAVKQQADELLHGLGDVHAHEARLQLSEALVELSPLESTQVYLAISGADAVEIALKTARLATGREGLVSFDPGYHGLTLGALEVTSRREFRQPFVVDSGRVKRFGFGQDLAEVQAHLETRTSAAVIVEPVVGREGVLLPPDGWLQELSDHCQRTGTLLIADEVLTGFGRTGSLFACIADGVVPDLLCVGKALGGGLPIGAVLGSADILKAWRSEGEARHTATFVGHPLACAAAVATLEIFKQEALVPQAKALGTQIADRVSTWNGRGLREVRGRGALWGFEVDNPQLATEWVGACWQHGLLLLGGGASGTVLQLCPPLTLPSHLLDFALESLSATFPRGPLE